MPMQRLKTTSPIRRSGRARLFPTHHQEPLPAGPAARGASPHPARRMPREAAPVRRPRRFPPRRTGHVRGELRRLPRRMSCRRGRRTFPSRGNRQVPRNAISWERLRQKALHRFFPTQFRRPAPLRAKAPPPRGRGKNMPCPREEEDSFPARHTRTSSLPIPCTSSAPPLNSTPPSRNGR